MNLADLPADSERWAAREVAALPPRWQSRALAAHRRQSATDERAANLELVALLERLRRAPAPHNATDADLVAAADAAAVECAALLTSHGNAYETGARYCARFGIEPPTLPQRPEVGPPSRAWMRAYFAAVARLRCPLWWRRQIRKAHARAVEASAIALGFVGARADRYVSDETLKRREQQNRRNADTLAATVAENDEGQRFTLAELAATSVANKAIRRGELITRIKGFEAIARDLGHVAVFVTLTAPSRFHPTSGGEPNPKHNGATPADAQANLSRAWARIRSQLARDGVAVYGFRIAEPHADACPHWHLLLFVESNAAALALWSIMRRHALTDAGDEAGANRYRLKFERIDASKGTATGYVIKYVAKAIDGFRVGEWRIDGDLAGDDTLNLAPRVEAWAACWRIRQFAQIGGPPVGLWRELRRIKREEVADAAPALRDAWIAAQRFECKASGAVALADWADFTRAAGGVNVRRDARPLAVAKVQPDGVNRYGEPLPPKPCGVVALRQRWRDFGGIVGTIVAGLVSTVADSARKAWRIVREGFQAARSAAPWTRVNNCTPRALAAPVDNFDSPPHPVDNSPPDPETFRSWAY